MRVGCLGFFTFIVHFFLIRGIIFPVSVKQKMRHTLPSHISFLWRVSPLPLSVLLPCFPPLPPPLVSKPRSRRRNDLRGNERSPTRTHSPSKLFASVPSLSGKRE